MRLSEHVHRAILAAGDEAAERATEQLRKEASEAGWPPDAVRKIRVHHHEGHLRASCEGSEDWEYGLDARPPLSVARRYHHRVDDYSDRVVADVLHQHLGSVL